ncbi:MAG TPA: terminase family protein [Allosphingosinicella sp.]|jgi:phage terminase large subunit-like protein
MDGRSGAYGRQAVEALEGLGGDDMRLALKALTEDERQVLAGDWPSWAHKGQLPDHDGWRIWVLLAGRGFGKTRAGAEWVSAFARANPEASIALVAANPDEARTVMIESRRSGLLAIARPDERDKMLWEPSRRRLIFASGAEAFIYSAANPESLRGPEHHIAWCDELAKWRRGQAAWDNLRLGLRLGTRPQAVVTTTPRAVPLLKRLLALQGTVLTGGASRDNPQLGDEFIAAVEAIHKGTHFGRQELEGVLLDDVEGALWTRALIERCRVRLNLPERGFFRRILVGVDPPASQGGTCGIVVCGLGADGIAYVLADCSEGGLTPRGWARKAARAAQAWGAVRVVAEKNNGGEMVEEVLRGADSGLPVKLVHAADGKATRAEPVAVLFEAGKAKFAGAFPELEDELAGFTAAGWRGAGSSPDRADAMVWAMTELAVKPVRADPRIRVL